MGCRVANGISVVMARQRHGSWRSKGFDLLGVAPVLILIMCGVLIPLASFFQAVFSFDHQDSLAVWHQFSLIALPVIQFTIWQVFWSAALTAAGGLAMGYAIGEFRWSGEKVVKLLSPLPFALPSVVVSFAFITLYGNSSLLGSWFQRYTAGESLLYNHWAIVAAHVFMNLPFTSLYVAASLRSIPLEYRKSVAILGLGRWRYFRQVAWYQVRQPLLNAALVTAGYSLSSFSIVMLLGGKLEHTTAELAVYQALRFDFNLVQAGIYAGAQLFLTAILLFVHRRLTKAMDKKPILRVEGLVELSGGLQSSHLPAQWQIVMLIYCLFLSLPIWTIFRDGMTGVVKIDWRNGDLIRAMTEATLQSLLIACIVGIVTPLVAWLFMRSFLRLFPEAGALSSGVRESVFLWLGISPTVLGFAWFVAVQRYIDPLGEAASLVPFVHVMLALPVCCRILEPALKSVVSESQVVARLYDLSSWKLFSRIEFWALLRPLALSSVASFGLSWGETAVSSMFAGKSLETLPVLMLRLMGSYHFQEAAVVSLVLAIVCVFSFYTVTRKST
jgi:thiamine transport system permease protein